MAGRSGKRTRTTLLGRYDSPMRRERKAPLLAANPLAESTGERESSANASIGAVLWMGAADRYDNRSVCFRARHE